MTALVTGASGFLGGHLVSELQKKGVKVLELGRGDIADISSSQAWFHSLQARKPDVIFHLMGQTQGVSDQELDRAHQEPTTALLRAVRLLEWYDVKILILGSAAEYGAVETTYQPIRESHYAAPISAYGRSKLRATEIALKFADEGLSVCVVRLFNVFSQDMPKWLMPAALLEKLGDKESVIRLGSLNSVRDYLDADVAMGCLAELGMMKGDIPPLINLCSGHGWKLRDIVQAIVSSSALERQLIEDSESSSRSNGVPVSIGSNQLLSNILGYTPNAPRVEDFNRLGRVWNL